MKNKNQETDYDRNKKSECIVYKFAEGKETYVSKKDFSSRKEFEKIKSLSDKIYQEQNKDDEQYRKKTVSLEIVFNIIAPSYQQEFGEDNFIPHTKKMKVRGTINTDEAKKHLAYKALSSLTKTQKRRYVMQKKHGLSIYAIAVEEKTTPQAVAKSIQQAEKKIAKFMSKTLEKVQEINL